MTSSSSDAWSPYGYPPTYGYPPGYPPYGYQGPPQGALYAGAMPAPPAQDLLLQHQVGHVMRLEFIHALHVSMLDQIMQ